MLDKRIYGIIAVESILANWNADFSGEPRQLMDGTIYATDKALKYSMRNFWDSIGEDLLIYKEFKLKKGELIVKTLADKYADKHGNPDKNNMLLKNLFSYLDVKQFGVAFAAKKSNVSITGAVQIGQGVDILDGNILEQEILSPFASQDGKAASTLGNKIIQDHSLYLYPFSINPVCYKNWVDMGITEGYTEDDYIKFKQAATKGATELNSCSKKGCSNALSIFISVPEGVIFPTLINYIDVVKGEGNRLNISIRLKDIIESYPNAEVEVYYNNFKDNLEIDVDCRLFNIITGGAI